MLNNDENVYYYDNTKLYNDTRIFFGTLVTDPMQMTQLYPNDHEWEDKSLGSGEGKQF